MLQFLLGVLLFCATSGSSDNRLDWFTKSDVQNEMLLSLKVHESRFTMLEIGFEKKSMLHWIDLFKSITDFVYVGQDSNPLSKELDSDENDTIHIEIGAQTDGSFLQELCVKHGPFNFIVDSSMNSKLVVDTMRGLISCMTDASYYVIVNPIDFNGLDVSSSVISEMTQMFTVLHHFWPNGHHFYDPLYSGHVKTIELLEGLIVIEKVPSKQLTFIGRGDQKIPYKAVATLPLGLPNGEILDLNVDVGIHSTLIPHADINALCRDVCTKYPDLLASVSTDFEVRVSGLKTMIINAGYYSWEPFLFDDDVSGFPNVIII